MFSKPQDIPLNEIHNPEDVPPKEYLKLHPRDISPQEHHPEFPPPNRVSNDHSEFNLTFTEESSSDLESESGMLLFDDFESNPTTSSEDPNYGLSSEGHMESNVRKQPAEVVVRNELSYKEEGSNDVSAEPATISSRAVVTIL